MARVISGRGFRKEDRADVVTLLTGTRAAACSPDGRLVATGALW
jgi:hypothetical protein